MRNFARAREHFQALYQQVKAKLATHERALERNDLLQKKLADAEARALGSEQRERRERRAREAAEGAVAALQQELRGERGANAELQAEVAGLVAEGDRLNCCETLGMSFWFMLPKT